MNYLAEPGVTQVLWGLPVHWINSSGTNLNTLLMPPCVATFSAFILLVYSVFSLKSVKHCFGAAGTAEDVATPGIGKGAILVYRIVRLVGCAALVALSIISLSWERKTGIKWQQEEWGMLLTYLYASLLALLSTNTARSRQQLILHVNTVLFAAFAVYAYRDVFPLATFTRVPEDINEGPTLWAKLSLLFVTAVVVPLFTPRQYIPVDPLVSPYLRLGQPLTNHVESHGKAKSGADRLYILVRVVLLLDEMIFMGYRNSELKEEELHPLCDTDASKHLKARSFPHLDTCSGSKKGHIFFGLLHIFRVEFCVLTSLVILSVLMNFASPIAMQQLLRYLEIRDEHTAHDEHSAARPWMWILLLFIGPTFGSLGHQFYLFLLTRTLVQIEAIITQLVFAHSLRIRMKAETTAEEDTADLPAVESAESASPRTGSNSGTVDETQSLATQEDGESSSGAETATLQASSSNIKSAGGKDAEQLPKPAKDDAQKSQGSLTGKINNLVTTDLGNIVDARSLLLLVIYLPLQFVASIWFLHSLLGWAAWVGLSSIVVLTPVPGYVAKFVQSVQRERIKRTDERVQSVSEAVNVLRMVKLFGWETKMKGRIAAKRDNELIWIRRRRMLDLLSQLVNFVIPVVTMVATFGTYVSIAQFTICLFSSITVFDFLRDNIAEVSWYLAEAVNGKVSLDRTELLDAFEEKTAPVPRPADSMVDELIGFRNATFSWSKDTDGARTRSRRDFLLKIEDEVIFARGRINLVVGPTGSGKTSLLHALLGEMHWIPSTPDSWYNLPRGDGVAYAAQESWVLNETIKDNIIFDTPFDEERYKKVLYQCALEPDLALFQAGDQTEVGEKGLTLSGGQKARLTLARAYSTAGILLLDDVLAALDVHTSQWIVEKCFGGDLVKGRTVILVTHNVALARPIVHFVVTLGTDGRVKNQGFFAELAKPSGALASQIRKDQQALDRVRQEVDALENPVPKAGGKLIVAEEIQVGHVGVAAVKMYLLSMAGPYPFLFFFFFFVGLLFQQVLVAVRTWVLGYWARQYDLYPAPDVPVVFYMSLFVGVVFLSTLALAVIFTLLVFGQLRASKKIHKGLIESVLSAPLRWLDVTPTSRIIARVTNDVRVVDDILPNRFWPLSSLLTSMLVQFVAVVIYTPIFFFPGLLVAAVGSWVGQIYIATQLPVKRLMSNARAPVLAHFGAAIMGLVSIRAYGAQNKFGLESFSRIDRYTRASRNFNNVTRWVSIRINLLGSLFGAALSTYLVYVAHTSAGNTGFILTMSVAFTSMLLWAVRFLNDFEVQGNSLERIQSYVNIEHEKPVTEAGKPPAYWPASGDLRVENLSARYSEDGPNVLHGVSFHVKSGERVGIVGRTGSGKSSLTLSLLRCIPTEGSVIYDGLETSELNLDALRSSITIIPQVPELLSGSLRANLDPFGQYDDVELNSALRAAGLFALQSDMDEGRITLESAIASGGGNLSVGQKQIFALARAIVRKSKILILDEATSAIDYATDTIIQTSLRQELPGDVSLITVAHRLQTIMDADKIMVLDAGRIVEFDSPKALLRIKNGKLRALVDESGDRDVLYAMAETSAK
ncbi:hypothetical protein C8J57DRAFT_1641031 [Mycena rebaudengoi]|nr:hypothetical protein C8J57DRAFT_1641031 [Mycena rebaudengoi]